MFKNVSPMVKTLFWVNLLAYLVTCLVSTTGIDLVGYLALYPIKDSHFAPYQLITHMFLHGGIMHILFNMIALVSIGPIVEDQLGERKFLLFYLLMGLGAAITQMSFSDGASIGASGAIYGIFIYFTFQEPNAPMFPFSVKAKYLAAVMIGIEVMCAVGIFGGADGIGHFAHLGGALTGAVIYQLEKKFRFNI